MESIFDKFLKPKKSRIYIIFNNKNEIIGIHKTKLIAFAMIKDIINRFNLIKQHEGWDCTYEVDNYRIYNSKNKTLYYVKNLNRTGIIKLIESRQKKIKKYVKKIVNINEFNNELFKELVK